MITHLSMTLIIMCNGTSNDGNHANDSTIRPEIPGTCDLWLATLGYHQGDEAKARAAFEAHRPAFVAA